MQERLDSVVSSLQTEEATLLERKSTLSQQVQELDLALKQIRGALEALGVRTIGKSSNRRSSTKPPPNQVIVREAVIASLDGHTLPADRLRTEVERRLQERGYSRMGLALRLKEVLADNEFSETPSGYQRQPSGEPHSSSSSAS